MIESWYNQPATLLDDALRDRATDRQNMLTKPPGSLGRLEKLAVQLAVMQKRIKPKVDRVHIAIFAGDHGIVEEGVSAFPQTVTTEMVRNFSRGGAAICVLAHELNTALEVINVGTVTDPGDLPGVINQRIAAGTANFCHQEAMSEAQVTEALAVGAAAVERAKNANVDMFIGGEMGIGNTTAASALACALTTVSVEQLVGPGTGLNPQGVIHKTEVLRNALSLHGDKTSEPLVALRCLGGFEIAALTGAYVTCAQAGLPVLVDGFIASVAALLAMRLCPGASQWFIFAHESQEPGHRHVLQALNAQPLLALNMRLGEGSGAAMAIPLLRLACALHNDMATFAEAGVSEKSPS